MLGASIYILGLIGIIVNRKNIINTIISIEIMLLGVNLFLISTSCYLDDISGNILFIYILTIAGCEAAIGLTIVILLYRRINTIDIDYVKLIKCI